MQALDLIEILPELLLLLVVCFILLVTPFIKEVELKEEDVFFTPKACLLYTSPSPRDRQKSRMPSSA